MFENGFWNRFARRSTLKQIIFSVDWVISGAIVLILSQTLGRSIMNYKVAVYISSATAFSRSLIAITITGVAIIVALTDKNVLATLNRIDIYDSLMIVFEFTVSISIVTTIYGIFIQSTGYTPIKIYAFTFLFTYLILGVLRLVSDIITFGEKVSQMVLIENLPDDISEIVSAASRDDNSPDDAVDDSDQEGESDSST